MKLDLELTAEELCEKYDNLAPDTQWGEHPRHTMETWRAEVENEDTRLGYWDWVVSTLERTAEDEDDEDDVVEPEAGD